MRRRRSRFSRWTCGTGALPSSPRDSCASTRASESDDFDLYRVVDYFMSYRAAVRAKVAAIAAGEVEIDTGQRARAAESARAHLELAATALASREKGCLVLVGGAVGTGKSTAARALADVHRAVVISSDRVRKHLLGIASTERASPTSYTPAQKARVYAELLPRAAAVIGSGRAVILDATWGRRQGRPGAPASARRSGGRRLRRGGLSTSRQRSGLRAPHRVAPRGTDRGGDRSSRLASAPARGRAALLRPVPGSPGAECAVRSLKEAES
jgi:hypothetical protein